MNAGVRECRECHALRGFFMFLVPGLDVCDDCLRHELYLAGTALLTGHPPSCLPVPLTHGPVAVAPASTFPREESR